MVVGIEEVRSRIGSAVRGLLTDGEGDLSAFEAPAGDPGLIGPGSVAWRVHADIAGLVGGVRALLLQTMHPLAMAGVHEFSDYRTDPFGRLHRTASFLALTTYGNTAAANEAIRRVRAVHDVVQGTASDGRPFSASDPELLRWVHATEIDSFSKAVARYGEISLSGADIDRYFSEMAVVGEALGATDLPRNRRELRAYWSDVRPDLYATREARAAAWFVVVPPVPRWAIPATGILTAAAIGMLPSFVRRALYLPATPASDTVLVRPAARVVVRALGWSLGESPVLAAAQRRMAA